MLEKQQQQQQQQQQDRHRSNCEFINSWNTKLQVSFCVYCFCEAADTADLYTVQCINKWSYINIRNQSKATEISS